MQRVVDDELVFEVHLNLVFSPLLGFGLPDFDDIQLAEELWVRLVLPELGGT